MRYQVHGVRTIIVSTEVEAEDEFEALALAEASGPYVDEWDVTDEWHKAFPL